MSLVAKGIRWVGMPIFLAAVGYSHPLTGMALPVIMAPTLGAMYARQKLPKEQQVDKDTLTYICAFTLFVGPVLMISSQMLIAIAAARLLFGNERSAYLEAIMRTEQQHTTPEMAAFDLRMTRTWQHWAFVAIVLGYVGGGLEEMLKYSTVAVSRWWHKKTPSAPPLTEWHHLQYSLAASLAYGLMESIGFLRTFSKSEASPQLIALLIFERVVLGGISHSLLACLSAVRAAKLGEYQETPRNWWHIIRSSVLWHGTGNLVLFGLSGYNGHVGWVHPKDPLQIGVSLLFYEVMQWSVYRQIRRTWDTVKVQIGS